jgi:uncharacterized protein (TIGR02757 family)
VNVKRSISLNSLKQRLEKEVQERNSVYELSYDRPDPLLVGRHQDEFGALLCALYGYGNAHLIVRFLDSLPFELLDADENTIRQDLQGYYYRFQSIEDVIESFITLRRMKLHVSIEECFSRAYQKEQSVIDGLNAVIDAILTCNTYRSRGYRFLFGSKIERIRGNAPMKRWMMYLRWMVRKDHIDMGLFKKVASKDLIMPLDTHTFQVSQQLGLLERKSYDLQAAVELTCKLKTFDPEDPVKYDFALYRIGQEKLL